MNTTEQDMELLLKDLCARLPYFPMLQIDEDGHKHNEPLYSCVAISQWEWTINDEYILEYVRPYLRPISNMTDEEYDHVYNEHINFWDRVAYCNKHYLDYHDLISKGLALPAPEGMYDLKN